jgi:hypothetical protein
MRVRKLRFTDTDEDRERFSLIYRGFLTGGNTPQKGMETTRRESAVLKKLDAVSDETDEVRCESCGQVQSIKRDLQPGDHEVTLTQPEFDLLKKYFETTSWTVRMSTKITDIADWLDGIPQEQQ